MNKKVTATLLLVLTAAIWGFAFVAQVGASTSVAPFSFVGIRFILGGVALLPVAFSFERPRRGVKTFSEPKMKYTLEAAAVCGVILFIASVLQQYGAGLTGSSGRAGFITGLYTVLTPIFALLFFKKKQAWQVYVGAFVAFAGLYPLCMSEDDGGFAIGLGEILLLVSCIFWALHILTLGCFSEKIYSLRFSAFQFIICGLISTAFALIFDRGTTIEAIWAVRGEIAYCAIFSTGIAYTLQAVGQKMADPSYAAIIFSLESVFAAIGGIIFGQDKPTATMITGCLIIFAGIIFSQLTFKKTVRDDASDKSNGRAEK